jgi:prophage regulatory protein
LFVTWFAKFPNSTIDCTRSGHCNPTAANTDGTAPMTRTFTEPPPIGSLTLERLPQVKARTGLARSTLYRMIACGKFPKNLKLSERCSAWNSAEIDAWIAAKIAARDAEGPK